MSKRYFLTTLITCLLLLSQTQCGIYTFNGANIDYETTKTISIGNFYNDTPNGPANLSQTFTEKLREYFQQNTNLVLVQEDGDLQLEGKITSYTTTDVAPTRSVNTNTSDLSTLTRLSITVQTVYINTKDDSFDFDRNFSFGDTFNNTTASLNEAENGLIETITDQIILDIFNASVANW